MPGHPALFLDRDGNLIFDHHHTCREDQIELIPGVKPALEACLQAGYRLFVLTNQSGINRGIFTWAQYEACKPADARAAGAIRPRHLGNQGGTGASR
jgi:histidinol phosphatase-like enzyme